MFNPNQYTLDEIVKLASVGEQALIKYAESSSDHEKQMPGAGGDHGDSKADTSIPNGSSEQKASIWEVIKSGTKSGWESTKAGAKAVWDNPYGKAAVIGGGSLAGIYALIKALSSKKKEDEDNKKKTKKTAGALMANASRSVAPYVGRGAKKVYNNVADAWNSGVVPNAMGGAAGGRAFGKAIGNQLSKIKLPQGKKPASSSPAKTASFKKRADEAAKAPERNTNLQNAGIGAASGATVGLVKKLLQSAFDKDADNSLASYLKNIGGYGLVGGGIGLGVNSAKDIIKDWKAKNENRINDIYKAQKTLKTVDVDVNQYPNTLASFFTGTAIPKNIKDIAWYDPRYWGGDKFFTNKHDTEYNINRDKYPNPDLLYRVLKRLKLVK